MLIKRIFSIIVAVPIIFACTYFGGVAFLLMVLAVALASINEFYTLMKKKGFQPSFIVGDFFTAFFILFAYFALKKNWEPAHSAILTVAITVALASGLFLRKTKDSIPNLAITIFGLIYIGWLFSYLIFIRAMTLHGGYIFFLMIIVWMNDITAYIVGKLIGKVKLSPFISPNKTIEGAAAGFLMCIAIAGMFGNLIEVQLPYALLLGAIIGIFAQASDLVESLIKRDAGVKDSSDIIPGHGGVLDRMDSFILTAPVMYYYLVWLLQR